MTQEKLVTKKEPPVCPYCKAELKGAKKKCPICHRVLSIAPTKKTEKERRIEMLDRQYNPENPEYATPTPESIPEQVNTHPTSWEWDDSETEPEGAEQKLPQIKEGFEDLQKFVLGGKYLFIEKGAYFELITLPSKTTGPDYVFESERKDKEIVKLSPEQLREMFSERKIFITKTIKERRKERADQIRRSRKYLGLNLLGQSFEFRGKIGSYEDVDESAVTLIDMDNKKIKIPIEEFKRVFLSPAVKTPSAEIGDQKFEEFRKKINAGEEVSLSFIGKTWKFKKVQGASVDGDHAVGYVLVQPDGSQMILMEKYLIEDFKNGTISIIENSDKAEQKEDALKNLRETIERIQKRMTEREKLIEQLHRELAELDTREQKEMKQVKFYSQEIIEQQIISMLRSLDNIKEVKSVELMGGEREMRLTLKVIAKKGIMSLEVGVVGILSNNVRGELELRKYSVEANSLIKGLIEEKMRPHLGSISKLLKDFIEKQESKKVKSLSIENGQLKVEFV